MHTHTLKRLLLLSLFLTLIPLSAQHERARAVLEPEDQELSLTDVIREVHGYGPPGYGEDKKRDSHITYWALELLTPINLPCTPEKPEWASADCASERRPHLFFDESETGHDLELKAKSLKDRKALVTGVLHRADTAGEITEIYMDVTAAIEPVGQDKPAVAPADESDSFATTESGKKTRIQHREIAESNFRIAGIDLAENEQAIDQAARILGKIATVATGDAADYDEEACYRSANANDSTYLLFGRGEVDTSFTLSSNSSVWKSRTACRRSSKITHHISTESGLHLGQTPDQVIAVLGLPTTRRQNVQTHRDEMTYELETNKKTASCESLYLSVTIHATFVQSHLTKLKVDWSETD